MAAYSATTAPWSAIRPFQGLCRQVKVPHAPCMEPDLGVMAAGVEVPDCIKFIDRDGGITLVKNHFGNLWQWFSTGVVLNSEKLLL